ncbi:xyloglucanase [Planctomonas sp. JC2975]|uniref:xyloglucanase n=1 Tax=Planctomonas sp. JC2975 TaxID=2729626 RepID=UPI001473E4AF|nr:xyloglucanase [Planctomonas sp. JC2975]NNC10355.1 xyloglucanase [Planctomonas sp. JC2975]
MTEVTRRSMLAAGLGAGAIAVGGSVFVASGAANAEQDSQGQDDNRGEDTQGNGSPRKPSYSWSNVQIEGGGFVPGIVYNPTQRGLVYARTDIGGAYRLDRTTGRWIPLTDQVGWADWNRLGVLSLATDPIHTSRVYLAVGMYTNEWDTNNGAILRSDDYGSSWRATPLPFKVGGNMPGRGMGERLQIDPNASSVLYYGAESGQGLWRSVDVGNTFTKLTSFPDAGDVVPVPGSGNSYETQKLGVLWTAFDAASSRRGTPTKRIFTAVADLDHMLYVSEDAGAIWNPVPGTPTGYLPHHGVIDEKGRVLYVSTSSTSGPYDGGDGAVWRYDIDDGTWTDITPQQRPVGVDFGFSGLTIDRTDPDTIMVASQIQWWPDVLIFRSTDRGATWSPIWDYAYDASGNASVVSHYSQSIAGVPWLAFGQPITAPAPWVQPTPKLGWMVESMAIDPFNPDEAMYGTGATIYRTQNLTQWDSAGGVIDIAPFAAGIEETSVQDLVAPGGSVQLVSAMADLGGFVHTDIRAVTNTFRGPYFGGATSVDAASLAPDVLGRAGTDGSGNVVAAVSTDSGATWAASPAAAGASAAGTIAVGADGASVVWAPPGAPALRSADHGATWQGTAGLPSSAQVEADRAAPAVFYAFAAGVFYRSTDGGATFSVVSSGVLPATGQVRFGAVPGRAGEVWLAGGSSTGAYGLWRSTDRGATWKTQRGFDAADTVGFGKAAPGSKTAAVYVAASRGGVRGFYRSIDGGSSWQRINDDQHQWGMANAAITGDPDLFGRVYIATNGRGIVVGDDSAR